MNFIVVLLESILINSVNQIQAMSPDINRIKSTTEETVAMFISVHKFLIVKIVGTAQKKPNIISANKIVPSRIVVVIKNSA
jgi:hypothetical protein